MPVQRKKPATCNSIPKLKIDWDKVDKEEYKKNVLVELEDFRYLKMKTPYGVEQSITHFINSIQKAINLCCPQNQAKFRRRKEYSWTLIIRSCRQIKKNILPMEKGRIITK